MAELMPKERLQPSLLDRLTDEEPDKKKESRQQRVLSVGKLRAAVLRDLSWLLNADHFAGEQLDDYPLVAHSVLNYGMPDLAGHTASSADINALERMLREVILDFEPRILRNTLKVRAVLDKDQMSHNALTFEIEGELWARPIPERMYLKTQVDFEDGVVAIVENSRTETRASSEPGGG